VQAVKRLISRSKVSRGRKRPPASPAEPKDDMEAMATLAEGALGSSPSAASTAESQTRPSCSNPYLGDEEASLLPSLLDEFVMREDSVVGRGAFGVVSVGVHKLSGMERAIKTVEIGNSYVNDLTSNEVEILRDMDHPNIVRYMNAFHEPGQIHIAMELCRGEPLFSRIVNAGTFCERDAAIVMRQAMSAVCYLHCRNIVHRDLKAENFLFLSEAAIEINTLKLIDFGLATRLEPGTFLDARVGTGEYMAPQVWRGKYDQQCDIWACGVIAYALLSGRFPFRGMGRKELRESILAGRWDFRHSCWQQISEEAKDLIRGLLKMSPKSRLTADQALEHEWVSLRTSSAIQTRQLDPSLVESLKVTQSQAILKQAILRLIVAWLDVDDVFLDVRSQFDALDQNKDGVLTRVELSDGLRPLGLTEPELESTLDSIMNGRSQIQYTEFLSGALYQGNFLTKDILKKAFQLLDKDGDGFITSRDLEVCQKRTKPRWFGSFSKTMNEASLADLLHGASSESFQLDFAHFESWLDAMEA